MVASGVEPTNVFFHMFIREARFNGNFDKVKHWYHEMGRKGMCSRVCVCVFVTLLTWRYVCIGLQRNAVCLSEILRAAQSEGTPFVVTLDVSYCHTHSFFVDCRFG